MNTSKPPNSINVKEKVVVYQEKLRFQVQLQGVQLVLAMTDRAAKLGLSNGDYVRELVEKDLVRSGCLPNWWFTRSI